jgi:hypothetical protein
MTTDNKIFTIQGMADVDLEELIKKILAGGGLEEGGDPAPGVLLDQARDDLLNGMRDQKARPQDRITAARVLGRS